MKKILIVDDDIKTASFLVEDLKCTYGFEVVCLQSAASVIENLKNHKYDIIILDLMMPVPREWSLEEQVKSLRGISTGELLYDKIRKEFPEMPILIYSAKMIEPLHDGKTIILLKPELNSEIVNRINKLISDTY